MTSFDLEVERLEQVIEAKRCETEWIREYMRNSGLFYDPVLKRHCRIEAKGKP